MRTGEVLPALLAALLLAATHLLAGRLRFLDGTPRSRWLSFGGGVSVAYVLVHLLPEVASAEREVAGEQTASVVMLLGLVVFYGLERAAKLSGGPRPAAQAHSSRKEGHAAVFWLHVASFGLYNLLIGYLLMHREADGLRGMVLFTLAMLLHFGVNDFGLRAHFATRYERFGRWILAGAVLGGAALGAALRLPAPVIPLMTAFLAGGVVLNVLKEELPQERESRFDSFVLGSVGYAALLAAF